MSLKSLFFRKGIKGVVNQQLKPPQSPLSKSRRPEVKKGGSKRKSNSGLRLIISVFLSGLYLPTAVFAVSESLEKIHSNSIVFLHFNDFYEIIGRDNKGGLLPLNKLLERQKKVHPKAIVTFGGDLISPSFYSSISKGQHMIDAMALLNVDIAVPGNHEFDFGLDNAVAQFKVSKFPWVISNLNSADLSLQDSTVPIYIHEVNGLRVGFMGLITPQIAFLSNVKAQPVITISKVIDTARMMVTELKNQNVDVIVALTHLNLEEDKLLAHEVKGIDLILGGHDHYPVSLMLDDTLILKSGSNGEYLGIIKVIVDKSGKQQPSTISWQLISSDISALDVNNDHLDQSENKKIVQYLKNYQQQLNREKNQHLATTVIPLDARVSSVRFGESSFGNLVADALRVQNKTDIALINAGAIRSDKIYPADVSLTENDILSALPFANRIVVVKVSGEQLKKILEHGVSAIKNYSGRFPQTSGLYFEYLPKSGSGQRISKVMVDNQEIEADKTYTLATIDYLLQGGDGYEQFLQAEAIIGAEEGDLLSNVVSTYLMKLKQIESISMGRVKVLQQRNKEAH